MSGEKSHFEAHDLHPQDYTVDDEGNKKYTGPERRKDNRRQTVDRREEVRFDPTKQDRRKKAGRRKGDKTPKFW